MNKIYVLGIGPGHRDYLTKKAEKIAEAADVLIGGKRALKLFNDPEQQKIKISSELNKIKKYILENYQNKSIAVLVSGDPGLYSLLNYLKRELGSEILEVIAGISSLQIAAAKIKLSWNDLQISSLHGSPENKEIVLGLIRDNPKVGLFTDNRFPPSEIAKYLLEMGIKQKQVYVFENLSYADEKITAGSLKEISQKSFSKLTVMIILDNTEKGESQ
ncbi:precorrin-6y C5,15-methyltransferase (decarboxylating) subunit CbiE [Halanaerobium hydrogeniformans]|uniref:Precorrin-6y C5,15-methyltransferase (Decarboxylating), CbiE subunit n=1 Tax=Halanaerobium hydrogeniformans TaxID=656519 RepID=E4RKA0_HALHG|nr:precorrin-6y C5,15-methyltransferase (decarboxylating) subunit CbiE [Halanaerobium hydrogeniformans]ADQ15613.1 precorrin-6y C5,15-methyltransferase (decarboxylating), CbiE subunit [Halanaerobium hydrogeniformans]